MEYIVIFDVIAAVLGLYLIYSAVRMKKTGQINTLMGNSEEIKECRDAKGFINRIYRPTLIFGIVSFVYGLFGCADNIAFHLGWAFEAGGVIVFLAGWLWFSKQLHIGKAEFF